MALQGLTHHRLRSLLTGGIVALIAFMVFMLTGLTRGLAHDNAALLIETPATHFVTTQDAEGVFSRSFITTPDLRALTGTLGPDATPLARTFTSLSAHTRQLSAVLIGVDPRGFLAPTPTQGAPLSTKNGAVVDESLQGDGVRLGDTLTLRPGGETVQVTGFTRSARLNHQPVIFIDLNRWHALNPRATGTVNAVALRGPAATLPAALTQRPRAQTLQALPGYREEQGSLTMIQGRGGVRDGRVLLRPDPAEDPAVRPAQGHRRQHPHAGRRRAAARRTALHPHPGRPARRVQPADRRRPEQPAPHRPRRPADRHRLGQLNPSGAPMITPLPGATRPAFRLAHLGFVLQSSNLIPYLTVREQLTLIPHLARRDARAATQQADALLARLGLSDRADHHPDALSGGQRQRVAIARALMNDPQLILADEPTASLDGPRGREVVKMLAREVHGRGRAAVMVTHDERVLNLCDRTVHIIDGQVHEA
nr:ATP-binding cassette domain-containing protein [Deinococcus xianganensis]